MHKWGPENKGTDKFKYNEQLSPVNIGTWPKPSSQDTDG